MIIRLTLYVFVVSVMNLISCRANYTSDKSVIKFIFAADEVSSFQGKYIYLVDASNKKIIDSVLVSGDTAVFNERVDSGFVPHMVSVNFTDTLSGQHYLRLFGFTSPYDTHSVFAFFYADKGETIINSFSMKNNALPSGISGSKQNEPYFRNIQLQYPDNNFHLKQDAVDKNIIIIEKYPYSIELLTQLFTYKERFQDKDLEKQLAVFDSDVKRTPLYKSFVTYLATSSTFDKAFPSILLENDSGKLQNVGKENASCNLIVYWASWCKPCRKEIPEIKMLYNKYALKGLSVTSISLDEDADNWQRALAQENMPWQQLIAGDSAKAWLHLHYNIRAIPKAYLFNRTQQLVSSSDDGLTIPESVDSFFKNK